MSVVIFTAAFVDNEIFPERTDIGPQFQWLELIDDGITNTTVDEVVTHRLGDILA